MSASWWNSFLSSSSSLPTAPVSQSEASVKNDPSVAVKYQDSILLSGSIDTSAGDTLTTMPFKLRFDTYANPQQRPVSYSIRDTVHSYPPLLQTPLAAAAASIAGHMVGGSRGATTGVALVLGASFTDLAIKV